MNKTIGFLMLMVVFVGCQKTEFDPPEYAPIFDADVTFSDGANFRASAGELDYYLYTKGFKNDELKMYSSTLSSDLDCESNCREELTLNIFQGDLNSNFTDIGPLDFISTNTQNVIHTLEASVDDTKVYDNIWKVNNNEESALSFLEFNQEFGENEDIGVDLIYTSAHKSVVRFGQTFTPLSEEDLSIYIEMSKSVIGTIKIKVVDKGQIEFIRWSDGEVALERTFTSSIKTTFNVVSKSGQQIKCSIKVPKTHPPFNLVNLGYSYTNQVVPEIPIEEVASGEVVYTDTWGNVYRSSQVSQILPNLFKVSNLEYYLENEEGIPTYSADVEFKCLVFCRETGKTKYISDGKANFAFIERI